MKAHLFFTVVLAVLLTSQGISQDLELWGLAPTPGYIYKLDEQDGNKEIVYSMNGSEGKTPKGSLLQASNKKLYGMTNRGGANDMGVLFEYDVARQSYTVKYDFDGPHGKNPELGSLIQASNGKLYGMTPEGGSNDKGVIFEYDLTHDTLKKLLDFQDSIGIKPLGDLYQSVGTGDSIIFYGLASEGGANNGGVLFEYNLTDSSYRILVNFDGYYPYHKEVGRHPYGSVIQADNGKIYGMTFTGGLHDNGVLFEYDPEGGVYAKKFDFYNDSTGKRPHGGLIQATDGKLYGLTVYGGAGNGVVFSYDIAKDTMVTRLVLQDGLGSYPRGSLLEASNGKMYATTYLGACSSGGVFDFDPVTGSSSRRACDGYPTGNLIEIEAIPVETYDTLTVTSCDSYLSPSGNHVWTTSGTYADTIPNVAGGDSIITINLTVSTVDISVSQDNNVLTANAEDAVYQWLDCDNGYALLEGDTNRVFTAPADGHYAVAVTSGSCTDTSDCYAVSTTGIRGNDADMDIQLYPNPAKGNAILKMDHIRNCRIAVYNIMGEKIFDLNDITTTEVMLPMEDLPAGIYFVKVRNEDQCRTLKLIRRR